MDETGTEVMAWRFVGADELSDIEAMMAADNADIEAEIARQQA